MLDKLKSCHFTCDVAFVVSVTVICVQYSLDVNIFVFFFLFCLICWFACWFAQAAGLKTKALSVLSTGGVVGAPFFPLYCIQQTGDQMERKRHTNQ